MAVKINYEYETVTIPAKAVPALERAGAADIRLLMALCTNAELRRSPAGDLTAFAAAAGCTEAQAAASLAFWRGAGVLVMDDTVGRVSDLLREREEDAPSVDAASEQAPAVQTSGGETSAGQAPTMQVPAGQVSAMQVPAGQVFAMQTTAGDTEEPTARKTEPKVRRKDHLPNYTSDQISTYFEEHPDTASFIEESQNVWGKMFNTHEVNILLGLVDYLGLDWEYVLILLSYCRKLSERRGTTKSLHYVETVAFGFYDEGVCDATSLQEKLRQMEQMAETEGQLRSLFGMGTRSLSTTEKRSFSAWLYDYGYGMDIIRRAYEIAVDAIGEPKIKYINSILSSWNSHDIKTLEEANAFFEAENRRRGKGKGDTARQVGSTFDTNDFFEAALRRNFGDEDGGS